MTRTMSSCKRLPVQASLAGWMESERKPCSVAHSQLSPTPKRIFLRWISETDGFARLRRTALSRLSPVVETARCQVTERMFRSLVLVPAQWPLIILTLCGLQPTPVARLFCCELEANNVYVTDSFGHRIYRYRTNAVWEVFAGSGNQGSADGNGIFTSFNNPTALAADAADNIYVWNSLNYMIRKINPNRDVVTIAGKNGVSSQSDGIGTNASFNSISGMCVDGSGNVILVCGSSIRKMTTSTNVLTMAGSFTQTGYTNGAGSVARFRNAAGVCVSQGMIFVADANDHRIRNLTFNPAPQPVSGGNLTLSTNPGLRITGVVGRSYRIESSADTTNWNTETTILLTSSPYLWIDPNSLSQKKFYRAFLLP